MLPPPSPGLTSSRDNWWSDCPFLSGETPSSTTGTGCCSLAPKTSGHILDQYICQVGYSLFNNTMWGPLLPAKFLDLDTVSRVSCRTREREGVACVCAQALQGLHSGMVARTHIAPISGISCPGSRPRKPSPPWREESGEAAWPSNSPCVCASKTTYPTALHPRGGSLLHFLSLTAILTGSPQSTGTT